MDPLESLSGQPPPCPLLMGLEPQGLQPCWGSGGRPVAELRPRLGPTHPLSGPWLPPVDPWPQGTVLPISLAAATDSNGPHVCLHTIVPCKDVIRSFERHFGTVHNAEKLHRNVSCCVQPLHPAVSVSARCSAKITGKGGEGVTRGGRPGRVLLCSLQPAFPRDGVLRRERRSPAARVRPG